MRNRTNYILRTLFIFLAILLVAPAIAQNTRGDRPVNNSGKIRQTQGKSVKKKSKATTKDVAGRRLRTKNKSSANRANVGIPQPITTQRHPRSRDDRPARVPPSNGGPVSRLQRRSDPDRSWQGDISGYKQRRIKPSSAREEARRVYPQGKYTQRHPTPKAQPFKGYENKTASGKPLVKRTPQRSERAWKGDMRGQPFYPPSSKTGSVSNVFGQRTRYSKFVNKNPGRNDRAFGNREAVARARRMGTPTGARNWGRRGVLSIIGQGPYVTRGRKNVYWGKMKISERAKTRDIAGKQLSRRNFRSTGIGITGRDSLKFFGRKPHGDLAIQRRKGGFLSGGNGGGAWTKDIAGYRLRKHAPGGAEREGNDDFSGYLPFKRYNHNTPIPAKGGGIGAGAIARNLRRTGGRNNGGAFHGNRRGALWNNNGNAIGGKLLPGNAGLASRYSGRQRYGKEYGDQGENYRGFLKTKGKEGKFIGSFGHKFWNNGGTAIEGKLLPGNAGLAGRFSGKLRDNGKNFGDQGAGYTGDLKQYKKGEYIGSRHKLWNNGGKATTEILTTKAGALAGSYHGNLKAIKKGEYIGSRHKLWNNGGKATTEILTTKSGALAGSYHGNLKAIKKGEYIGSRHTLWNNGGKPTTEILTTKAGALAGSYHGNLKAEKKGKFIATPNKLWNNNGKAVTEIQPTKAGAAAGIYSGRMKAKTPQHYPLNTGIIARDNGGKATTQIRLTSSGAAAGKFQGNTKYHETKKRDSDIESRLKMKQDYVQNPHSVEEATKKQKPNLNYKAGNFASGARIYGKRMHSPNSVDEALDAYHNQASARRVDYQGNVKMRKFIDHRQSPDARFVNTGENNTKEDRTLMTNMKLFWARMFQKSDSQPSNLKERSDKLRYDKGEKGLWAD